MNLCGETLRKAIGLQTQVNLALVGIIKLNPVKIGRLLGAYGRVSKFYQRCHDSGVH